MRKLVLMVLGSALLCFGWYQFRADSDATEVASAAPQTGGYFMTSVERAEALDAPMEGPASGVLGGNLEVPETRQNGPFKASGDLFDIGSLGDLLREGELMAHRVGDLQGYLTGDGARLSLARRNLLIAYGLLIRGMPGQADKYASGLEEATEVTAEEWELLQSARRGGSVRVRNAAHKLRRSPLVLGVSMGLMAEEGERLLREQDWRGAAEVFSELLLAEVDAPWSANRTALAAWSKSLAAGQANHRWNRQGAWPHFVVQVEAGDSLVAIRKRVIKDRPRMALCTGLMNRSNQLGKYLRAGQELRVPTDTPHTIVDLSARWLFYMHAGEVVAAWPVAIGRAGEETTPGSYQVGEKAPEPPWYPPGGMVPYGDPENPLGTRWIGLENSQGLGIHGTWEPETIGTMASDGCIRLANQAVEELFEIIPRGSVVLVRP